MKISYIASVLAMTATLAFACDDNEDRVTLPHVAGAGTSGSAGKGGGAGSTNGGSSHGGGSNAGSSGNEDVAGASGAPELGGAGGNNAGGEHNVAAAGEAGASASGGAGGAGGEGSVSPTPPLELIGDYDDNFGGSFVITQDAWGTSGHRGLRQRRERRLHPVSSGRSLQPEQVRQDRVHRTRERRVLLLHGGLRRGHAGTGPASTATADPSDPDMRCCGWACFHGPRPPSNDRCAAAVGACATLLAPPC